jgi:hypothetical protein
MFSNIVIVYLQVSEVRLFGEEDVTQDLFITFCQWQDDSSKVLVLGQRYYQIRLNLVVSKSKGPLISLWYIRVYELSSMNLSKSIQKVPIFSSNFIPDFAKCSMKVNKEMSLFHYGEETKRGSFSEISRIWKVYRIFI